MALLEAEVPFWTIWIVNYWVCCYWSAMAVEGNHMLDSVKKALGILIKGVYNWQGIQLVEYCLDKSWKTWNVLMHDCVYNGVWKSCCFHSVDTVYPTKYAHGFVVLCFVVIMQSFIMNSHEVFIHIHQGCFAGTGVIVRFPQCQWSKPDGYGKISQCITTTKHSKAKTVCIFLGIYCMICESQLISGESTYT